MLSPFLDQRLQRALLQLALYAIYTMCLTSIPDRTSVLTRTATVRSVSRHNQSTWVMSSRRSSRSIDGPRSPFCTTRKKVRVVIDSYVHESIDNIRQHFSKELSFKDGWILLITITFIPTQGKNWNITVKGDTYTLEDTLQYTLNDVVNWQTLSLHFILFCLFIFLF